MKKIIKTLLIFLILMIIIGIIYINRATLEIYEWWTPQKYITVTEESFHESKEYYCGEIGDTFNWANKNKFRQIDGEKKIENGQTVSWKPCWIFRSDDKDITDRKMAYLAKYLVDGINGNVPAPGYKAYYDARSAYGKDHAKQNTWQGAFWLWESEAINRGETYINTNFLKYFSISPVDYPNSIWTKACSDAKTKIPYKSNSTVNVSCSSLEMKGTTGSFKVNSCTGKVASMTFSCNGKNYTILGEHSETENKEFKLYSDSNYTKPLLISNITKNTTVYVKKNISESITSLKLHVKTEGSGFAARVIAYYADERPRESQNLITVQLLKGEGSEKDFTVNVKNLDGKITIRKIDYDDNTLINGSEFVILAKGTEGNKFDGWLGYSNGNVTTGNTWKNVKRFKTGDNYCSEGKYDGEFTLNQLPYGDYYIFEVSTGLSDYSLKGQPGYSAKSNYNLINKNEWKMVDNQGNGIESVLICNESVKSGFTDVSLADGTPYNFKSFDYTNTNNINNSYVYYTPIRSYNSQIIGSGKNAGKILYGTNHSTFTVRNRKNTKLTIVKKDKNSNTPIANVGIKVLVKTTEKRYELNSFKWLKSDGTITSNVKEAYEFKTDKNGEINILNVPYGVYYIFETSNTNEEYELESQEQYMKGKPNEYKGNFLSGKYVYLGTITLGPTTNNDITSDRYNSEVIENGVYKISSNINNKLGIKKSLWGDSEQQCKLKLGTITYDNTDGVFRFRISYVDHGYYLIESLNGYRPISIVGKDVSQRGETNVASYNGANTQLWKLSKIGTNVYNILSKLDNNYGLHIDKSENDIKKIKNVENEYKDGINIDIYNNKELNTQKFNLISTKKYSSFNTNGKREVTIETTNSKKGTKLTIIKQDGTYNEDLNLDETLRLKGAELKIYANSLEEGDVNKGWLKEEKQADGSIDYNYVSYQDATTFIVGDTGEIEFNGIIKGNYYIYETKTPSGYNPKEQPGYHQSNEGSSDLGDIDWVFIGNQVINDQNYSVKYIANNYRYVRLKGKVWLDTPFGKENIYNYIYNENDPNNTNEELLSKDSLLKGITVNLIDVRTNDIIASTDMNGNNGTDENGEYIFTTKNDGRKLTYWDLAYCYVEFKYDDREYVVVTPFVGDNNQINSKAQQEEIILQELDDSNLTGNGKAITYKGPSSGLNLNIIINNAKLALSERLLTGFYNSETYTVENINLGLIKKIDPEYDIGEEIEYVKIVKGNYTFKYQYGENAEVAVDIDDELTRKTQSTVVYQKSAKSFTHNKIYPSDVLENEVNNSDDYKIYVVYKIKVGNLETRSNIDLYKEKALYLTSLTNKFDSERYELSTDTSVVSNTDTEIKDDITLWSRNDNIATFDINKSNKSFKEGNQGIGHLAEESVFIQFKVTNNALKWLVEKTKDELDEIYKRVPTEVSSMGYHIYERNDKNWKENKVYTHKTIIKEEKASALFIKWYLASTRIISGNIFEDKEIDRPKERIGNGFKDSNENVFKDVAVSLIKADGSNNVAKLYTQVLEQDETTQKWKAVGKDAIDKTDENGDYKFEGVVTGKYYLKFEYGDGTIEFKNENGETISDSIDTKKVDVASEERKTSDIDANIYKSTIITGAALNLDNKENWYIDSIKEKNYSIAVDEDQTIQERQSNTEELNHSTLNEIKVIKANSPIMDIGFENVKEPEIEYNQFDELIPCTGMNFGIIERPHVQIELNKIIKNVKITLQNGTTIINGDPADQNVSKHLVSLGNNYAKIETDEKYLYGASAEITYSLYAINNSDLDYATSDYYKYGIIENGASPVSTTVTKIVDYITEKGASYSNYSDNVTLMENIEDQKTVYFDEETIEGNKKYTYNVLNMDEEIYPSGYGRSSTAEYEFTVNKLLSYEDSSLGWESYSEIIGITNVTFTPQYLCHSGNYIVRNIETSEADNADATIAITSATGANKGYLKYICIIITLVLIGCGIIIIKKCFNKRLD